MIDNPRIGPPPAVSANDEPNVLTRPSNLPIFAGVVILAAADFVLPWASIPDQVVVDGRNEPDGLITLFLGLLILVLALSRAARESDSRTVQIVPALLGLSVLASMLDSLQVTSTIVSGYVASGDSASLGSGMTAEVIGSVLVAVGGVAMSVSIVRWSLANPSGGGAARPASVGQWLTSGWVDPEMERIGSDMAVLLTVGAVGVVLGWVTAVWLDGAMGRSDASVARLTGLGLMGILLGPAVTVSLWRRLTRRRP